MQSTSDREELAVVLGRLLADNHTSIRRAAHLSGVSRRTLENWVHGQVLRPRHWEPILQFAKALHLSAAETDALLKAAGQPLLASLLRSGSAEALDMARDWQATSVLNRQQRPATRASTSNLPSVKARLFGRQKDRTVIRELLGSARLLTLTGAGGIGKTTLAIAMARDVAQQYTHGVCLVEIASAEQANHVPLLIADALRLTPPTDVSVEASLARLLSDRRMLLLLDNCEHLLDACAALSADLLAKCPHLTILATSRATLRLAEEQVYQVSELAVPPPGTPTAALTNYPAAELFVERARALDPTFGVDADNASAIAEIVRRLDGVPLAIELAAARTPLFTPQQIARRLDDRFALLTASGRLSPLRQQTLRAAMDWSYALLSAEEQALFQRLGVFANGWTFKAAEAVGGQLDTLNLLQSLVDKSLVRVRTVHGRRRYDYLQTSRDYALERLEADDAPDRFMTRMLAYYVNKAEFDEARLSGRHQLATVRNYQTETENLRAIIAWGADHDLVQAIRLATALDSCWYLQGRFREAGDTYEMLAQRLNAANITLDELLWARFLRARATAAWQAADLEQAGLLGFEALGIFRTLGDEANIARQLDVLCSILGSSGRAEEFRALVQEGISMARRIHADHTLSNLLQLAGARKVQDREFDAARAMFQESIHLHTEAGRELDSLAMLEWLTQLEVEAGNVEAARQRCSQMRHLSEQFGFPFDLASVLYWEGRIAFLEGNLTSAKRLIIQSINDLEQIGSYVYIPGLLVAVGDVARQQGNDSEAREIFQEAINRAVLAGSYTYVDRLQQRLADMDNSAVAPQEPE